MGKFETENCECGWKYYYSQLYGVPFPCIHEIGRWEEAPKPPERHRIFYNSQNEFSLVEARNETNFSKKIKNKKIAFEKCKDDLDLHVPNSTLGADANYMRKEAWSVVKELNELYSIPRYQAIDIVIDQLLNFKLQENDNVIEKTAMFRLACWNQAKY